MSISYDKVSWWICEYSQKECKLDSGGFGSCGDWNGDRGCVWCKEKIADN